MSNIYQHKQLQERQGASPALTTSAPAKSDDVVSISKLSVACRGEKTGFKWFQAVCRHLKTTYYFRNSFREEEFVSPTGQALWFPTNLSFYGNADSGGNKVAARRRQKSKNFP